jgi:hypothetical protein
MNINLAISPLKILMLFYLLLVSNLITNKLNAHLIEDIKSNSIIQHIMVFTTILVLFALLYTDLNLYDMIIYTFITYFIFILSTKLNKNVVYGVLLLLGLFFIKNYYNNQKINILKIDPTINGNIKEQKINKIREQNITLNVILGLVVIGGALFYDKKKYNQYGGRYSLKTFFNLC